MATTGSRNTDRGLEAAVGHRNGYRIDASRGRIDALSERGSLLEVGMSQCLARTGTPLEERPPERR